MSDPNVFATLVISEAQEEHSVRTIAIVSWSLGMGSPPYALSSPGDTMRQNPKTNEKARPITRGTHFRIFQISVTKSRSFFLLLVPPEIGFFFLEIPTMALDELANAVDEVVNK